MPGSLDSFGLGMLGAVLHVQYGPGGQGSALYRRGLRMLLWCVPVSLFVLGWWLDREHMTYWKGAPILYLWTPLFSATVLVLILNGALGGGLANGLFAWRPVFFLGTVSYGVYLWHYPIGKWLMRSPIITEMSGYSFPRMALIMLAGSLVAAAISWYLVESRAISLARRAGSARRAD